MSAPADPSRTFIVRAPTRIDLGGGWTDVPPYCDEQGGFVCNMAINRHAVATVLSTETYARAGGGAPPRAHDDPLIAAALRRAALRGVAVTIASDFPVGAGLGGSSAASAAVLGALARWRGDEWDRVAIAEEGRRIEVEEMGIAGGRQDHYAATHGGALGLTFTDRVSLWPLQLSGQTEREFERRSLLIYTGESRISGDTVRGVLNAYRDHDPTVRKALDAMKALARQMADALEDGSLDDVGTLVGEHWLYQRSLHPAIPTPRIDEIVMRAQGAGAIGWKAMGASGGGCVLVICGADNVDAVRAAIAPLGTLLPFALDRTGLSDAG